MKPFDFAHSDSHAMHERIREYCPRFRGHYQTREEMTEDMIRRLNEQIPEGSIVLHTGDIALNWDEAIKFLNAVHVKWRVCFGNHDKGSKTNRKGWEQSRAKLLRECPNVIEIADEFIVNVGKHKVLCSHFPWAELSDERHATKYMEYRPRRQDYPGVSFLLHGHIHSLPEERLRDRALDIGWDAWGYAPSYEEIEGIINART